jgi:hypothetical protein
VAVALFGSVCDEQCFSALDSALTLPFPFHPLSPQAFFNATPLNDSKKINYARSLCIPTLAANASARKPLSTLCSPIVVIVLVQQALA